MPNQAQPTDDLNQWLVLPFSSSYLFFLELFILEILPTGLAVEIVCTLTYYPGS